MSHLKLKLYLHQKKEIWKDIKGYESLYQVSSYGRVKSLITNKIRKEDTNNWGYKKVTLHKDGKSKSFFIHRLVATHFIKNPNKYSEVNHKDGDKSNNHISNLEWCTRSHNMKHAIENELITPPTNYKNGKWLNGRDIKCTLINNETGEVIEFKQMKQASEFLGHYKDFIYRKKRKYGNIFTTDGFTVKVGDAQCISSYIHIKKKY